MLKRIISAAVLFLIAVPIIYIGGNIYISAIYILSLMGLYEFIKIKDTKKVTPLFIKFILYIMLSLMVLTNINMNKMVLTVDYKIIAGLLLTFLIPTVLYHDKNKYSISDAFFLIGVVFFLGSAFKLFIIIRNHNINLLIYLLIITITTDVFAYFTGYFIGRNKLLECISPKKTWEGLIGGTIAGIFVSMVFYHNIIDANISLNVLFIMSFFLSILGQLGDLLFSAIKRYYGCKDFSNIMPGHGGVLDRLDSIIFVLLGFMFFISVI